ncbi:hypothetical protein GCM10009775_13000 [Microbacterium aoyamense]|uniref:Beta-lactamase-related domain-containing protein n=1 Tax=Microbacterium aoyamense TaxID=344166 RepID=A0ABN2PHE4_9MICO|nr:serine hydrolase [Microbacterium aoyamense]
MTSAERVRDAIVADIEASGFGAHGLHVRVGDEVAAHRWTPDVREDIHSAAKAVCFLAVGIAVDEGAISVDEPIATSLPSFEVADREMTLRRLLSMTSGVDFPWTPTLMTDWPDLAREFLSRPSAGRGFQYSNASTYTAMRVLDTRVGDVAEYLGSRLFAPLGIEAPDWTRCPNGYIEAGGGLWLRTEELARIGLLVRDRGVWEGSQLVSAEWVGALGTEWSVTGSEPPYAGYSLGAWAGPGAAWRIHGAYGQLVILQGDAVVTITADDHFGADAAAASVVRVLES